MPTPIDAARAAALAVLLLAARAAAQPAVPPGTPAQPPSGVQPEPRPEPPASEAPASAPAVQRDEGASSESLLELTQALREGSEAMTADQAAALAVKTAPSVSRARAASDRAREAASDALIAVYPRLELEARYTRLSRRDLGFIPEEFEFADLTIPLNNYLLQARLTVPLSDVFLQILPRYRAAQGFADAERLNAQAAELDVALQTREAYYNYARTRASLVVARSGLAQTEAQRRDVAALVSAGTVARVELMRADAQVAAAQVAVERAEGAVAVARTSLRTLIHRPGDQDIALAEDFAQPLPPLTATKEQLFETALAQRKEVAALRALTRAHGLRATAEGANRFPKLAVLGTFDYANPNQAISAFDEEWNDSWTIVGSLTWSPNDFFSAGARQGQANADRAQTEADIRALEDTLRREVAAAYEDYQTASRAMESALAGIRAADETYRVRREQFRAGAAVSTDVILAETELRRARLELVNAAIDMRIARARLDRAVGRGGAEGTGG